MNIENVKIDDATDANYVIRKFFNGQFKKIKMEQLEQLVLTVYNIGKKNSSSAGSESSVLEYPPVPAKANPFKINDRVKTVEDVEIGRSGKFISTNTAGMVSLVEGDTISFLFESDEDGEMIEASILFDKLEKIT